MITQKNDSRETAQRLVTMYDDRRKNPTNIWGIPWGIKALDGMTGGIQYQPRPEICYLFSRPSVGKTSLAASITYNVASWLYEMRNLANGEGDAWKNKVVRCVLLEGSRDTFQDRMACMKAEISHRALKTGRIKEADWEKYKLAQRDIFRLPIEYLDAEDTDVGMPEIDAFIRQEDTGWWMLDHIGCIPGARQGVNQLSDISKGLRNLCKATAPAMILTHQNRTAGGKEGEKDQRPSMENLAGADFIVRDADMMIGLYRKDLDRSMGNQGANESNMKMGEAIVLKNRNDETGTIHLTYNTWYTQWSESNPMNQRWLNMLERN